MTQKDIKKENLTTFGSVNLIMQVWGNVTGKNIHPYTVEDEEDTEMYQIDQYQPRKNRVWSGKLSREEVRVNIKDTIERLKIGQQLLQDWLDGKIDNVYYWDLDKLPE